MKKSLIFILILVIVGAVCVITCPDTQAHRDALAGVVNSKWNKEVDKLTDNDVAALFGASIGSKIIEMAIDNRLEVKNYFVYSVGQMHHEDGPEIVSVGVLGHVFTISEEEFSDAVDNAVQ